MAYMHIDNLYKNGDILLHKRCYAMEKIHGTSAHISYKNGRIAFFSGGAKYEEFVKLFDIDSLQEKMGALNLGDTSLHIYGEAYGGKMHGMSATYGNSLKFVVFEVKIGDMWLAVPQAESFANDLGLEFVHYLEIPCDLESIDRQMNEPSVQAIRNGIPELKMREGIVLRPLIEVRKNNGERIIAKHKRPEFSETRTPRVVGDKLEKMAEANAIVKEWATEERLSHILGRGEVELQIENIGKIIELMVEDIYREGEGEIVESNELRKAIGRTTALMCKRLLNRRLMEA